MQYRLKKEENKKEEKEKHIKTAEKKRGRECERLEKGPQSADNF